ncbi:bacterial transcriptional activator domain-containing protein [bacterium]|nr:bacterial transcriptional activator domain-containing protein [bacterium]
MKKMICDIDRLERIVEKLRGERKTGSTFECAEALAESLFRLALHPRTAAQDAIARLMEARGIDDTNPRYAYHLSRIHMSLGSLDQAVRWLKEAVKLCPTSHRLWAHIGLLQHELNDRYTGNSEYEPDALRKKADRIFLKIRGRENSFEKDLLNFTPPRSLASIEAESRKGGKTAAPRAGAPSVKSGKETDSPDERTVERLSGVDQCRWSGVIDLEAERNLEQGASRRQMDALKPLLDGILRQAGSRRAGTTAFVVIAIQWMIIGYPVASIRRLMGKIDSSADAEALELLDHVCSLFETPIENLSRALSDSLSERGLPPLLIAMIHQSRLLWRKFDFPATGAYRSARQLLDPSARDESDAETEQKAGVLIQKLISAAKNMDTPPPAPIADAAPEAEIQRVTPEAARDILNRLDVCHQNLKKRVQEGFDLLKGDLEPRLQSAAAAEAAAQVRKDYETFTGDLNRLTEAASAGVACVDRLQKQILGIPSEDLDAALHPSAPAEMRRNAFTLKLEECKKAFNELNPPANLKKIHARIGGRLPAMTVPTGAPAEAATPRFAEWSSTIDATELPAPEGKPEASESPAVLLDALEAESKDISGRIESYWALLKKMTGNGAPSGTLTPEQAALSLEIRLFIDSLPKKCESAVQRISSVRRRAAQDQTLERKSTELESRFKDHLTAQGRFGRHLLKLSLPAAASAPGASAGASEPSKSGIDASSLSGLTGLRRALEITDGEMDRVVGLSMATFEEYSEEQRSLPELRLLELSVHMKAAGGFHRLGRLDRAREIWRNCLSIDRLCLPALKNIAVADTLVSSDHGRTLLSWKSYCEVLYFHAIAADNPRVSAADRSVFHRDFASAFANGFLWDGRDKTPDHKGRGRKLIDLLNSPGSLQEFVVHKQAEFLNRWFEIRTPVILLGCDRSLQKSRPPEGNGKDADDPGAKPVKIGYSDTLLQFVDRILPELPERIGRGFRGACASKLQSAVAFCGKTEGLTLENNPYYHDDESRLIQWIEDVYRLKFQFFYGFFYLPADDGSARRSTIDWGTELKSFESLAILDRLNDIPTQFQKEIVESAVKKVANEYHELLQGKTELLDSFLSIICMRIWGSLINKPDPKRFESLRGSFSTQKRFWRKICSEWEKGPDENGRNLARLLDDPRPYYPESVQSIFGEGSLPEDKILEAVSALRRWCIDFPEMTGPARLCAALYSRIGKAKEAVPLLEKCVERGFSAKGVKESREILAKLKGSALVAGALGKKEYKTARNLLLKELEKTSDVFNVIQELLGVYHQWIKGKPDEGHSLIPLIDGDITTALRSASKASGAESGDTRETRQENEAGVIENKRQLMVAAALAPAGQLDTPEKCEGLIPCLEDILKRDPDNLHGVYYLGFCCFRSAAKKFQGGSGDRGKGDLQKAFSHFQRFIKEGPDGDMKEQAVKMRDNITDVLKGL